MLTQCDLPDSLERLGEGIDPTTEKGSNPLGDATLTRSTPTTYEQQVPGHVCEVSSLCPFLCPPWSTARHSPPPDGSPHRWDACSVPAFGARSIHRSPAPPALRCHRPTSTRRPCDATCGDSRLQCLTEPSPAEMPACRLTAVRVGSPKTDHLGMGAERKQAPACQ